MRVGTLAEIWRYPVKSLQGESLARATLTPDGIPGDRGRAVVDAVTGHAISGKRLEGLVTASAREGAIMLPDGQTFPFDGADEPLSAWLNKPVRLGAPTAAAPVIDSEAGRTFEGRPGGFFDSSPLHLVTSATLDHLRTIYPGDFDRRRFRPNLYVVTDGAVGPVERGWLGRTLRIGGVDVEVVRECTRCILTTSAQADLPKDRGILGTVEREQDGVVGVHVQVRATGDVASGDPVILA